MISAKYRFNFFVLFFVGLFGERICRYFRSL